MCSYRYKKFNFYDELMDDENDKTPARMRGRVTFEQGFHGANKIPRPPFVYAGGNSKFNNRQRQQQQKQQQQHRNNVPSFRSQYQPVKPGPNYESFRVPPPQQRLRHNLAHVGGVGHYNHNHRNPDKEAFAKLHAGYFNKGRSHGQVDDEDEESPGYTDGYVNDDHEDEDDDDDGLAPNSVYQEEVRGGVGHHKPNIGHHSVRGRYKHKYIPIEEDYEDRGEEDIMGVAQAPGGQPVYPEEQEYETREEEESDVAALPHVTGEEREEEEEEEEDDPEQPYRPRYSQYRGQEEEEEEEGEDDHEEREGDDNTLREYNDEEEEEGEMEARYRPSYRHEDTRHRGRHHDRDRDYYDVDVDEEEEDFDSTGSGARDNHWDEYFDGARKAIDYDIGGLIMNDESYEPDGGGGGGVDNSGKQPQEEEGEEGGGEDDGGSDYDQREEEEPRQRSNHHQEEEHPRYESSGSDRSDETGGGGGGSSSVDYDTYMELQKKERDLEKELENDVDKKFTDMYRGRQENNAGNK